VSERLERLRGRLEEPLLVSNPVNLRYLTDFASSNAALLVDSEGGRLFTDFRYAVAARDVPGVELVEAPRNLYAALGTLLPGRVGFEPSHLTFERHEQLAAAGVELVPRSALVECLREVKEEGELALVRQAAAVTNAAYERLAQERFSGRTERELAWQLEVFLHESGAEGPAFELIVASGPNAALPHSRPTDRVIGTGETVIVDAGCALGGYNSDCTRTFATGVLPGELASAYEVCAHAQAVGVAAVRPGVEGTAVDAEARAVIEAEGLGRRFGHGLGHGVGLEVHERPWLNPELESVLAAGNVVTVEPGIYLPGLGGIRIEDLVVVREEGPEVLTTFPRELVVVG
jgi:Xaa-Pro aminopeptidase